MSIQLRDGLANQSVDLVLEDLLVRFLVNCPDEDLSSIERVFFQVEEAQWFYTDFLRQLNPSLPSMKMKTFASRILEKCPLIWKWGDANDAISRFGKYKSTIPVRGVACFNKDLTKLLLVKGTESNAWSFPRGKISKDESDIDCAIRESEEEIGYNVKDLIQENDAVERTIKGKNYKIYLIKNVDENYPFHPKSRNEISSIKWHDIKTIQKKSRTNPNNYFIVGTVLKPMIKWINKNKGITNEDELMYIAELKLKDLLGITKPQENVDAGRELLNILQKAVPKNDIAPTIQVPQNLQLPFQYPAIFPYQHGPPQQTSSPFFNPHLPPSFGSMNSNPHQHQPVFQNTPYYDPLANQPNPQTLQKPPLFKNGNPETSRELLSILNTKPSKKESPAPKNSAASESNRSKAQNLLNLFKLDSKLDTKSPVLEKNSEKFDNIPTNERPVVDDAAAQENPAEYMLNLLHNGSNRSNLIGEPSNELEGSFLQDNSYPAAEKKIKLLKRSNKPEHSNASDLLGLLTRPKEQAPEVSTNPVKQTLASVAPNPPAQTSNDSSNELLNMLRASKPAKKESPGLFNLQKLPEQPVQDNLSRFGTAKSPSKVSEHKHSNALLDLLRAPKVTESPANELLDLLKSPSRKEEVKEEQSQPAENFDDFEDFEDFGGIGSEFNHRFDNFDIASDEEDVDHILDSMTSNKQSQEQEPLDLFQDRSYDDPKKKIRLLKPGQDIKDILQGNQQSEPYKADSNSQGQSLLALLNGSKSTNEQDQQGKYPQPDNFGAIYGSNGNFDYQQAPVVNQDNSSNTKSAAFFMNLLNKKE